MVPFFTKFVVCSGVVAAEFDSLQLLQSHVVAQPKQSGPTKEPRPFEGEGRRIPSHPRADDPTNGETDAIDAHHIDAHGEYDKNKWADLIFTNVVHNNLGGMGPDVGGPEGIRYGNVATVDGESVDLLLTADGYNTTKTRRNGLTGEIGIVNMVNNNAAQFKFKFLVAGTDTPKTMGQFILSFLDLDKGMKGGRERLTISGYQKYKTLDNTEVVVDAGAGTFEASVHGTKADNPDNPKMLTDIGARRTVNFEFPGGMSELPFHYEVEQNFNKRDFEGREFMFAGMTSVYFCQVEKVDLDFSLAGVVYSNLGNLGPDFDKPEGLRYSNVATFADGRKLDMTVNAMGDYKVKNNLANGLSGKFGQVSMMSNTETRFKFTFKEPGTDTDATVDWMYFSIFDLDQAKKGKTREVLKIEGVSTHFLTERSLVEVTQLGDTSYQYMSTRRGTGKDNPKDPMAMTQRQRDMSVSFLFHNKTGFEATFGVTRPYGFTRNFCFAGQSNTIFC